MLPYTQSPHQFAGHLKALCYCEAGGNKLPGNGAGRHGIAKAASVCQFAPRCDEKFDIDKNQIKISLRCCAMMQKNVSFIAYR